MYCSIWTIKLIIMIFAFVSISILHEINPRLSQESE